MADVEPSTPEETGLLVTVKQALKLLGISRSHFYRLCNAGVIRVVRLGRAVRVPVSELRRIAGCL